MKKIIRKTICPLFDAISCRLYLRDAKKIFLLEGLQSGGSSLVSTCFLQHPDANGILDLHHFNNLQGIFKAHRKEILKDFFMFKGKYFVVKFTCGHYNIHEMIESCDFLREKIIPVAITRDPRSVISSWLRRFGSLKNVYSGYTGRDGRFWDTEVKPWSRIIRFCEDISWYSKQGYPVVIYEKLCVDPEKTLMAVCDQIGMPYRRDMVTWTKSAHEIFNYSAGNVHGPRFDRNLAKCNCDFDEQMLKNIQTDFNVIFEVAGYPLLDVPKSVHYCIDDYNQLVFE